MPYDEKTGKHYDYTTEGIEEYKQATGKGMPYAPFKMKAASHDNSPMKKNFGIEGGVGSSPAKGWLSNLGGAVSKIFKKKGARTPEEAATDNIAEAEADLTSPRVEPHGPESHIDGGAGVGGGAPQDAGVWNVGTAMGEMKGMDRAGRKEYMQGLTGDQRKRIGQQESRQRMANMTGRSFMGVDPTGGQGRGAFGFGFSDIRLKEKIQRTGNSPSGIPIYEFNYIGDADRYSGAMAQDLLEINPDAVSMDTSGYYKVNYDNIDVDMHLIN